MSRLLTLLALLAAAPLAAQPRTVLTVRVGLDANRVEGLTAMQALDGQTLRNQGLPVAVTDSFPSFLALQAEAVRQLGTRTRLGLHAGYGSTSGRLDYSDYSGTARADRRARRVLVGVTAEQVLARAGAASVWAGLRARASFVTVTYERTVVAAGLTFDDVTETYRATPVGLEPGLAIEVATGPAVLRAEGGWEISTSDGLTRESTTSPDDAQDAATAWGGYRFGLAVGTRF